MGRTYYYTVPVLSYKKAASNTAKYGRTNAHRVILLQYGRCAGLLKTVGFTLTRSCSRLQCTFLDKEKANLASDEVVVIFLLSFKIDHHFVPSLIFKCLDGNYKTKYQIILQFRQRRMCQISRETKKLLVATSIGKSF